MDPGVYGEKIAFQFPTGTTTQGPVQIEARINADDAISEQFTLWSNAGSQVVRGNLLVLPIGEDALLYVEPIFLQAQGAPFPEFVRVIMADQNRVAFAETVEEGRAQRLGEAEPPPPEEPGPSPASSRRPSACTPRRRMRWRTAISARTRSESTSWPRCWMPWPRSAIRSGRPCHRLRGARARARVAAGPR